MHLFTNLFSNDVVLMQLRFNVTDEFQEFLHRFLLVGLHVPVELIDLLPRRLLDLCFHVSARTQDLQGMKMTSIMGEMSLTRDRDYNAENITVNNNDWNSFL